MLLPVTFCEEVDCRVQGCAKTPTLGSALLAKSMLEASKVPALPHWTLISVAQAGAKHRSQIGLDISQRKMDIPRVYHRTEYIDQYPKDIHWMPSSSETP